MKKRDSKTTSRIMSVIKGKDTKPELKVRKELWKRGYRYRVNYKKLPGKPDIVFVGINIAIFIDGDFWHGHNWKIRGMKSLEEELSGYTDFWKNKIKRNVERDREVNENLIKDDWLVVRIWESDISKNFINIISSLEDVIKKRRSLSSYSGGLLQLENDDNQMTLDE